MNTRREIIKAGAGLAAILATGRAPAAIVRSMLAMRNASAGGKPLPYDSEVEYIGVGSTVGPYIDTGYSWTTDNVKIEIEFTRTGAPMNNTGLFGSQKKGWDTNWGVQFWQPNNSSVQHYIGSTPNVYSWNPTTGQRHGFVCETTPSHRWTITIDGESHTGTWSGTLCEDVTSIGLFSLWNNSNITDRRTNNVCVHSFKLTDNGVIVRDYHPVRFTNADGIAEGAMYDRANPDGGPLGNGLYPSAAANAPFVGACIGPDRASQLGGGV